MSIQSNYKHQQLHTTADTQQLLVLQKRQLNQWQQWLYHLSWYTHSFYFIVQQYALQLHIPLVTITLHQTSQCTQWNNDFVKLLFTDWKSCTDNVVASTRYI